MGSSSEVVTCHRRDDVKEEVDDMFVQEKKLWTCVERDRRNKQPGSVLTEAMVCVPQICSHEEKHSRL